MSDLVGNPEDRFSQNEAHLFLRLNENNNRLSNSNISIASLDHMWRVASLEEGKDCLMFWRPYVLEQVESKLFSLIYLYFSEQIK